MTRWSFYQSDWLKQACTLYDHKPISPIVFFNSSIYTVTLCKQFSLSLKIQLRLKGKNKMRILINSFRRLTNLFGVQFLSQKNYKKLVASQEAITRLGIKHTSLEAFLNVDKNDNIKVQTEKFALLAGPSDSYFKKLDKTFKQNTLKPSTGSGNSIEDTHMAQYNEGRIARMLLQEKLTTMQLSETSKAKIAKRARPSSRISG